MEGGGVYLLRGGCGGEEVAEGVGAGFLSGPLDGVVRDVDGGFCGGVGGEVADGKHGGFGFAVVAQEGVEVVAGDGIARGAAKAGGGSVGPVEAVEAAFAEGGQLQEGEEAGCKGAEGGQGGRQQRGIAVAMVVPLLHTRQAGVVEDAGAAIVSAIATGAIGPLGYFLPIVEEDGGSGGRILCHHGGGGNLFPHPTPMGGGSHAGFIVVFEVAHAPGEGGSGEVVGTVEVVGPGVLFVDVAEGLVGAGVVHAVEAGREQIGVYIAGGEFHVVVVGLCHEEDGGIAQAGVGNEPMPERGGNHVSHIAAEGTHALRLPPGEHGIHDAPGARYERIRRESPGQIHGCAGTVAVIGTVVELDGFVPIVGAGGPGGGVVAGDTATAFFGCKGAIRQQEFAVAVEGVEVVEGVVARKEDACIIL